MSLEDLARPSMEAFLYADHVRFHPRHPTKSVNRRPDTLITKGFESILCFVFSLGTELRIKGNVAVYKGYI